ncbi:MAG: hypothetical protein ABI263_00090 [Gelidibacter sp.]
MQDVIRKTDIIGHVTLEIFDHTAANDKTRNAAALSVAKERIEN